MKNKWLLMLFTTAMFLFLANPVVMAEGKCKKSDTDTPAGWGKGKKEGWTDTVPPAYDKKSNELEEDAGEMTEEAEDAAEAGQEEADEMKKRLKKMKQKREKESKAVKSKEDL